MRGIKLFLIGLILIVLAPIVAITLFGEPIARSVVSALNDRFPTEIIIREYDVNFWSTFPTCPVGLADVAVTGSDGKPLLEAEGVDFLLPLNSLFSRIRVERIVVRDGTIQLFTDEDGNTNYRLTGYDPVGHEPTRGATENEPTEFAITAAKLRNVVVTYRNVQLGVDMRGRIDDLTFSGDFGTTNYLLSTQGDLYLDYLDQQGDRYAYHQPLTLRAATQIDNRTGVYTLAPLFVVAGGLDLNVVGTLRPTEEGIATDLRIESQSGSLGDVIKLIPPTHVVGTLTELETKGDLELAATVRGDWTETTYPRIEGLLNFTEGRIGSPKTNVGIEGLNLQAVITYLDGPRGGIQNLDVRKFTGAFRGETFRLRLLVEDLLNPKITFNADGAFALEALPALVTEGVARSGGGYLRAEGVHVEGRYEDMLTARGMNNVRATGRVTAENATIERQGGDLTFASGALEFRGNALALKELIVEGEGTKLEFSGTAVNLIPVLFADSLNTNDAELRFTATLKGKEADVDAILALTETTTVADRPISSAVNSQPALAPELGTRASAQLNPRSTAVNVTDLLRGTFIAAIDAWNYGNVTGKEFTGELTFTPGTLTVTGTTDAMGGDLTVNGDVYLGDEPRLAGTIAGTRVDVHEFFTQGENFGQDVITAANLEGQMNARIYVEAAFDSLGDFNYDDLRILAHLKIRDGELRDFGMLKNFAYALKSDDLERVRFTGLENYLEIVGRKVYIPAMKIQSSVINMDLAGEHGFNQDVAYYLKLNAGQAIANKLARHDDELDVLPNRSGWFNLHYSLLGPLETFAVARDKGAVNKALAASALRREAIRKELNRRFVDEELDVGAYLRDIGW